MDHSFHVTYLLPLLISTGQLFFVGTYLPHRKEHPKEEP